MKEDKQKILNSLCNALQQTNGFVELVSLEYVYHDENRQQVRVTFKSGYTYNINVTWDSGIAMIRDVLKHI